jgi:hypothetical protein
MKRLLLLGSVAVCMVIMMSTNKAIAQEDESTTVQITIKEDGKVTTDTTFELKEGQDHDMVKKMVQHMAGGDEKMMKKEVIIMHKGDDDCDHKELAWVYADGDDAWSVKSMDMGIDLDSLKEAHGGEKVMVFKDEDGNITVKELGEDEEHEMHFKHEGHGDHEIMIIESDEDGEKVKIKKMKKGGGNMMIISEDEHVEWTEEDGENVEVYVIKKGDKDVKVVKKVTVEIEDESEEGVEKEVEVEVKTEKKKKKEN